MRQAGEPSVEEILESIKKVIARDNRAEAEQVRRRREHTGVAERPLRAAPVEAYVAEDRTPVLELTDAEMAPVAEHHSYDDAAQTDAIRPAINPASAIRIMKSISTKHYEFVQ